MDKKPVLLLIFNRPLTTKQVCTAIAEYQPRQLFIAADGSRGNHPGESEPCQQAREIATQINWPCEVKTLFRESNLGCRAAVSSAIDWFFAQVEDGIILEDDCLPSPDFFTFCAELLDKYRGNQQVMHIGGANFQEGRVRGSGGYYASALPQIWGWATWRRAWTHYDVNMADFPEFIKAEKLRELFPDQPYKQWRWRQILQKTYEKAPFFDTWDYQWTYALLREQGVALNANFNLVKNIGDAATHQVNPRHCQLEFAPLPTPLPHPDSLRPDLEADNFTFQKFYRGNWKDYLRFLSAKLRGCAICIGV